MIEESVPSPGAQLLPCGYRFLEPVTVQVVCPDGVECTRSYGIGEIVKVMEYDVVHLVPGLPRTEIPLEGGEKIVDWPAGMRYEWVGFD